jgi:hypothetical protein
MRSRVSRKRFSAAVNGRLINGRLSSSLSFVEIGATELLEDQVQLPPMPEGSATICRANTM